MKGQYICEECSRRFITLAEAKKHERTCKAKNKLKARYADFTDRQLLESIASSLGWIAISIGIILWIVIMNYFFQSWY